MQDQLNRDEFLAHVGYVREDIQQVAVKVDVINGRLRKVEGLQQRDDVRLHTLEDTSLEHGGRIEQLTIAQVAPAVAAPPSSGSTVNLSSFVNGDFKRVGAVLLAVLVGLLGLVEAAHKVLDALLVKFAAQ